MINSLSTTSLPTTTTILKRYEYNVCNYSSSTVDKIFDNDPTGGNIK